MTLALPSSPHWAPTTTVTGIGTLPGRVDGTWDECTASTHPSVCCGASPQETLECSKHSDELGRYRRSGDERDAAHGVERHGRGGARRAVRPRPGRHLRPRAARLDRLA